jgi:hypothetical protein
MLANKPTNIDSRPSDLEYWVRRATSKREAGGESHAVHDLPQADAGLLSHQRRVPPRVQACSPSNLFVTLQRLATARMQTAGVAL